MHFLELYKMLRLTPRYLKNAESTAKLFSLFSTTEPEVKGMLKNSFCKIKNFLFTIFLKFISLLRVTTKPRTLKLCTNPLKS